MSKDLERHADSLSRHFREAWIYSACLELAETCEKYQEVITTPSANSSNMNKTKQKLYFLIGDLYYNARTKVLTHILLTLTKSVGCSWKLLFTVAFTCFPSASKNAPYRIRNSRQKLGWHNKSRPYRGFALWVQFWSLILGMHTANFAHSLKGYHHESIQELHSIFEI